MTHAPLNLVAVPAVSPDQAPAIAAMLAGMDPWLTLGYSAEVLTRALVTPHPDLTRYLAVRAGRTEGVAVVRYPWLRGAYIELLAVFPAAQRGGVGSAMLAHLEACYRGRTANLWLLVSAFNVGARGFYAQHGFGPIGTITDLVVAGQDEVLMRKPLQGAGQAM